MNRPPALLFGVPIGDLTMDETVDLISDFVRLGRDSRRTFQIATANVDFLVNAMGDEALHAMLQRADLCLADGSPVVWASHLLGMPIRERVAGSDLLPRLVERSASTGLKVHVLGSSPQVAARASAVVQDRYPGARFSVDPAAIIDDPSDVADDVLESIAAVDPDILCVALGNPKQERFIDTYRERLGVPVLIGIGGTLDMLTGERKRAPRWMQRAGLEWVFRAAQEPRRLGPRYARDLRIFGPLVVAELRAARRRRGKGGLRLMLGEGELLVRLGEFPEPDRASFTTAAALIADGTRLRIRCETDHPLSDRAASYLVGAAQLARRHGTRVEFPGIGQELSTSLRSLSLDLAAFTDA